MQHYLKRDWRLIKVVLETARYASCIALLIGPAPLHENSTGSFSRIVLICVNEMGPFKNTRLFLSHGVYQ